MFVMYWRIMSYIKTITDEADSWETNRGIAVGFAYVTELLNNLANLGSKANQNLPQKIQYPKSSLMAGPHQSVSEK